MFSILLFKFPRKIERELVQILDYGLKKVFNGCINLLSNISTVRLIIGKINNITTCQKYAF